MPLRSELIESDPDISRAAERLRTATLAFLVAMFFAMAAVVVWFMRGSHHDQYFTLPIAFVLALTAIGPCLVGIACLVAALDARIKARMK